MSDSLEPLLSIANRRIAFVGKLGGMNRREARELVRQHGGIMVDRIDDSVDLIVIGADQLPMDDENELLDDHLLEAVAEGRLTIINESQLWQAVGAIDADLDLAQCYTPAMLADLLDLPISTIRRWHRRGLIKPVRQVNRLPYFDFQEVASARRIASMIASGASPKAIENKLSRLADLFPGLQRPLSQLSVIIEGKDILLRQGGGLIEPGGQMRFDFDASESEDSPEAPCVIAIDEVAPPKTIDELVTPQEFIDMATEREDAGDHASAIEVYRAMSLALGPSADICFRMAELMYLDSDLSGARERYYCAIELEERFVEARGSLGCVLMEQGELELARSAFLGALHYHPNYPDVHYHLARLLDDLNESREAEIHWHRFLELAPRSPWAEEARERLGLE